MSLYIGSSFLAHALHFVCPSHFQPLQVLIVSCYHYFGFISQAVLGSQSELTASLIRLSIVESLRPCTFVLLPTLEYREHILVKFSQRSI